MYLRGKERNCVMECHKEYPYESIDGTICNDMNYYYLYYDNDSIIYYSCLNLSNIFALNSSSLNSQQKCMSSCPQGFYYLENEYICLDKYDYNRRLFYKYKDESQASDNSQCSMHFEKYDNDQNVLNDNQYVKECPSYMFIITTLIQMGSKFNYQ